MKAKKLWWVIGVILALIVGAIIYTVANKGGMPSYSQPDRSSTTSKTADTSETINVTTQAGTYIDYSEENYANAEGRRWLFFHAGWCPQCRALEKDIQESGVPDGVTILKVDYDNETELKKKYGVTLQTTIVEVDEQGNKLRTFVAYDDPTLDAVVNALGD